MEQTFSVIVYLRAAKLNSKKEAPLYGRITVNGKRAEISLKYYIKPEKWDEKNGKVKGNKEDAMMVNKSISYFISKVKKLYHTEIDKGNYVNAEKLKNHAIGIEKVEHTVKSAFEALLKDIKSRLGTDYVQLTIDKYEGTKKHLYRFLKDELKRNDVLLRELNFKFVNDFEIYLKSTKKIGQNQVVKQIERFRKSIRLAIANEWIDKDPFVMYHGKMEKTNRTFLSDSELDAIEKVELTDKNLIETRDCFIFSCYTGIAFKDLSNLEEKDLVKNLDGETWIRKERSKTGTVFTIPLLPKALEIIEKYKNHPKRIIKGKLLPMSSNAKMNNEIKIVAKESKIVKKPTIHEARHTFATIIALNNGVPIETLSKMLGHNSIKTTQIYGKILEKKISDDMKNLKIVLSNNQLF